MNLNFGGIFNRINDWMGKAGSLSNQMGDLLNKTSGDDNANGINKTQSTNFWSGWFGRSGISTPGFNGNSSNTALRFVANNVEATHSNFETGLLEQSSQTNAATQTTNKKQFRWGEGANKDGYLVTIKAKDLGLERWQSVDPKAVSRTAMEKAVVKMGITKDPQKAAEIVSRMQINGMTTQTNKGARFVTASDYADKDWMNERLDINSNYAVQLGADDIANVLVASKEVLGADFKPPANVPKSQMAIWGITIVGGGLGASIALRGAAAGGGTLIGSGMATPILLTAAAGIPFAVVTSQYLKTAYENGLERERAKQLPVPFQIPTLKMEDAGDAPQMQPQSVPESKKKDLPYAEPQAPSVPNIPTAPQAKPSDIAKPENKVQPQAKPEAKSDPLEGTPQPYTPDAPRNNQPMPNTPQLPRLPNLPKGIPEAIAAATTAAIGLKAVDIAKSGKDCSYEPVRYVDATLNSEMRGQVRDLLAYRKQHPEFPQISPDGEAGTLAKTVLEGKTVYGHSTVIERAAFGIDNEGLRKELLTDLQASGYLKNYKYGDLEVSFLTHAETEALIGLKQQLGDLKGKDITIYVDREPCPFCYKHLPKVAEMWGINSITLVSSDMIKGDGIVTITKKGAQ